MRIGALILLLANLAVAAYFALVSSAQRSALDVRSLEINADQVKQLRDAPVTPKSATAACLEWGPLAAAELVRAREALTKLKIEKTSVRESPGTMVWWVHLPPSKSRDEAERRVRDIEELGVRDARVVNDEGWRNAVSLGIFRSEEAANAYQVRMREIKVRNIAIVQRSDLVKFSSIAISEPTPESAARIVEIAAEFVGSEVKAAACAAAG
jgi:hypothetical protein